MSLDIIRQNIVAAMEAAKVGTPGGIPVVEYDNRMLVNTQTQSAPFVICNIVYGMGEQADLNAKPIHRLYGQIHLIVATKEGGGSTDAAKMLGYLYPQLQGKVFGIVRTSFASPAPPKPHLGWVYTPILIPFWADITY
jgi:hypothetical protein